MHMYGWVPSLFTWNYHNTVNRSCPDKKLKKIFFKRCSISLVIGASQVTMRYYFTPTRIAKNKSDRKRVLARMWRSWDFTHFCWKNCKMEQPLWKTVWQFHKSPIELPYTPAIPLLHTDTHMHKLSIYFIQILYMDMQSSIIYNSRKVESTH